VNYGLHNPYVLSASFRLFVDGISVYKQFISKLDEIFHKILLINFYYSYCLDGGAKSLSELSTISPAALVYELRLSIIN
jgi:hypothetical protein